MESSGRAREMAMAPRSWVSQLSAQKLIAGWLGAGVWFGLALLVTFGWVGAGMAFLAWSVPAAALAVVTERWARDTPNAASQNVRNRALAAWVILALLALDGGNHFLPAWSFIPVTAVLLLFPVGLTVAVVRRLAAAA